MNLAEKLPSDWKAILAKELQAVSFRQLEEFLSREYVSQKIYPREDKLFTAFHLTPFEAVRVVILGQDPYHEEGQAQGLAFSVPDTIKAPPSLRNIFKELQSDTGLLPSAGNSLVPWAQQGVLLLNTVLTVRAGQAASHKNHGWEEFTDGVISALTSRKKDVIYLLWGAPAQKKTALIGESGIVFSSAHPSPLSAHRGFFGSRPFSRINDVLRSSGKKEIMWGRDPEEFSLE